MRSRCEIEHTLHNREGCYFSLVQFGGTRTPEFDALPCSAWKVRFQTCLGALGLDTSHRHGTQFVASSPLGVQQVTFGSFQYRNPEQGFQRLPAEDEPVT